MDSPKAPVIWCGPLYEALASLRDRTWLDQIRRQRGWDWGNHASRKPDTGKIWFAKKDRP